MRRSRIVVAVSAMVLSVVVSPVAAADPVGTAAAAPISWSTVSTPPMSGDTSQKVYRQVDVVPGGTAFATGWTRHELPGTSEVRTLVEQWNGSSWQTMNTPDVETAPAADYLWGISGSSATDVWAVGRSATAPGRPAARPLALHYDGSVWTRVDVPDPSGGFGADMSAVVSISPTNVWAVGTAYPLEAMGAVYHWDGAVWSSVRLPLSRGCSGTNYTELTAITATPDGDVYAGGDCPTASGYAGFVLRVSSLTRWQVVVRLPGRSSITDMTADANGTVWATGTLSSDTKSRAFLLSGSGTTWARQLRPATGNGDVEQASGVAVTPGGITMVGERDTSRGQRAPFAATWTGTRWQGIDVPAAASTTWLTAIDGSASGPVWAMGQYLDNSARMIGFAARP